MSTLSCLAPKPAWLLAIVLSLPAVVSGAEEQPVSSPQTTAPQAMTAAAPTSFLDAVTVTATRTPTSVQDAPGSVSVIDAERIEREVSSDARDLVRYEPGVYVEGEVTRLGLSGFNIRGIGGNRVLTQIDGVPTIEQFSFGPLANNQTFLDLDAVDTVEIVRNAGSSLYGSDALGGVVSVLTKDPSHYLDGQRGSLRLRAGYDSRDEETSESVTCAFGSGRWQGSLVVTHRDGQEMENQGEVRSANSTRTAPNPRDRESSNAFGKLVFAPRESSSWKLGFELLDGETETAVLSSQGRTSQGGLPPGAVFFTHTTDLVALDQVERQRFSLENLYQRQGGPFESLRTRLWAQQAANDQTTSERRTTTVGGGPLGPVRTKALIRDGRFDFEQDKLGGELVALRSFGGRVSTLLTYGLSATQDSFDQLRDRVDHNAVTGALVPAALPFPTKYFPESEVMELGAFVQAELELAGGRLKLVPGLRYDRFELDADQDDAIFFAGNPGSPAPADLADSALSPRLSVVYSPNPEVSLYGQYSRGFRAPPYSDVNNGFTNLASGYTSLPNPDLEPETSDNYELGVRARLGRASLSLALFDNHFDDFIETVTVGFNPSTGLIEFQPQNLRAVKISGVELAGDVNLTETLRLRGAFTYIEGEDEATDQPLNSIAPEKLVVGLLYRPASGRLGLELVSTLVGSKGASDLDRTVVNQFAAPAYELFDLLAFYDLTRRLGIQVGLFNLTDETYWEWANVRGVAGTSVALDRYTSPGFSTVAALRWRW